MRRVGIALGVFALAGALAGGCGGGGGGDSLGGGIQGTGSPAKSVGAIEGFGSIFVNGVEYETAGALIFLDGAPAADTDLRLGMYVGVTGRIAPGGLAGTADRVEFADEVEGTVQSIDRVARTLVVLGKTVRVTARTVFADTSFDALVAGDIVEVSGPRDAAGVVSATRIELKSSAFVPGATEFELVGLVANLNAPARRFTLGTLPVDYSGAVLRDLPPGGLRNGLLVEVKSARDLAAGVLLADEVEGEDEGLDADEGDEVEIEGFLTRFASAADFDVRGQPVRTTGATRFEGGTAADLALNVRVEVKGTVDPEGVVVAARVEFEDEDEGEGAVQGFVTRFASAADFDVEGQAVTTNAATRYEDGTAADLALGVRVEVEGTFSPARVLVARKVKFEDDRELEVQGVVTRFASAADFAVAGRDVRTTAATRYEGGGPGDIALGVRLEVEGRVDNFGVLVAEKVKFEDD